MVTSAVDISIGTGKNTVASSTLNTSFPSTAVSSIIPMLIHLSVAPGDRNENCSPPTKSLPTGTCIFIHIKCFVLLLPGVALPVSVVVTAKSRAKERGMLSTTHTSTDPSFSTAT